MVTVNISNKAAYVLIGILAVVIFTGIGISLNSGDYLVHGHDSGELDLSGVGGSSCSWKTAGADGLTLQQAIDGGATGLCYFVGGSSNYKVGYLGDSPTEQSSDMNLKKVVCDDDSWNAAHSDFYYYACN